MASLTCSVAATEDIFVHYTTCRPLKSMQVSVDTNTVHNLLFTHWHFSEWPCFSDVFRSAKFKGLTPHTPMYVQFAGMDIAQRLISERACMR